MYQEIVLNRHGLVGGSVRDSSTLTFSEEESRSIAQLDVCKMHPDACARTYTKWMKGRTLSFQVRRAGEPAGIVKSRSSQLRVGGTPGPGFLPKWMCLRVWIEENIWIAVNRVGLGADGEAFRNIVSP